MKKNKRSIIPISLLVALVAVFITYASSKLVSNIEAGGQKKGSVGNTKYRELKQNAWGNEPVKIAKLQVAKGKTLELGKKVLAEDDWLRGLTISVTNVSAKNIVYIDLELHFLRSKAAELNGESITAFPLSAGNSLEGVRVAGQNNTGHSLIFQPGETLEMSLSDEEYSTLQSHLTKTKHPDSVKDVEIIVREVIFDDTTRWSAGRLFLRNPEQPDMWLPIQQTRDVRRESSSPASFQKAAWSSSLSSLIATAPQNQCGTPSPGNSAQCQNCQLDGSCCRVTQETLTFSASGQSELRNVSLPCRVPGSETTSGCGGESKQVNRAVVCSTRCLQAGEGCTTSGQCCSGNCQFSFGTKMCAATPVGGCEEFNSENTLGASRDVSPSLTEPPDGSCPSDYFWDGCKCVPISPIVVDISGNGINLSGAGDGVHFDINGDGTTEPISWTMGGSDDSWLILDRNGNGSVDSGREMFGNFTPQPAPPTGEEKNGFLALALYDRPGNGGNADGVIDVKDTIFPSLRLWQDTNHNGFSESNELYPLTSLGALALHLDYRESKRTDTHGNQFRYRAKVEDSMVSKVGRWAWDVFLVTSQ